MNWVRRLSIAASMAVVLLSYQNCAQHKGDGVAPFNYMSVDYLKSQVDLVVEDKCVSCHTPASGLPDLKNTNELITANHVVPGDPGSSNFYRRFIDIDRLEYDGLLSQTELDTIRDWICVQSEDNTCGLIVPIGFDPDLLNGAPVTTLTQLRAEVFDVYNCTGCHNGQAGLTQFDDYTEILGRVIPGNPSASLIFQSVVSGSMPTNNQTVSAEDKIKIYTWILDGAKNN